jgi:hypothetical protein
MANEVNTNVTESINLSFAADFSFLQNDIGAMFVKEDKGMRLLVMPTSADDAPEVSLGQLKEDLKKLAGGDSAEQIEKSLKSAASEQSSGGVDLDKITFCLKMLYLFIDTTDGNKNVEYAVNIVINSEGLVPDALKSLVDVKQIGIAAWNTTRSKILEKMSIVNINQYLGIEAAAEA